LYLESDANTNGLNKGVETMKSINSVEKVLLLFVSSTVFAIFIYVFVDIAVFQILTTVGLFVKSTAWIRCNIQNESDDKAMIE
jgi:hypothetical protein